jgi:hypothetical protein
MLGCGILQLTNHRGVSIRLPLKPELLAMLVALHTQPVHTGANRRPARNIVVLAR